MVRRWEESKGTLSLFFPYLPGHRRAEDRTRSNPQFFPVSPLSCPAVLCICLWRCKLRGCTYTQQRSRENMHKHALLEGGTVSREGAWNPSRKAYPRLQTTASPWLALLWDLHSLKENSAPSLVNKQVFKADGHFTWEMHSKVGSRRQN